jgi:3-deoxy-7-phosphoheptulonate synthase
MGVAAIFETRGNDDCHVILRGGKGPNYEMPVSAPAAAFSPRPGSGRR